MAVLPGSSWGNRLFLHRGRLGSEMVRRLEVLMVFCCTMPFQLMLYQELLHNPLNERRRVAYIDESKTHSPIPLHDPQP